MKLSGLYLSSQAYLIAFSILPIEVAISCKLYPFVFLNLNSWLLKTLHPDKFFSLYFYLQTILEKTARFLIICLSSAKFMLEEL
jgi:hypothetical protein